MPVFASADIKSIASLRSSKGLDRFVYISCSPKAALRNWVDLARPSSKAYKGNPFVATAAIGVDMFPHTHHKEMVLLFERVADVTEEVETAAKEEVPVAAQVQETPALDNADEPAAKVARLDETETHVDAAATTVEEDVAEPAAKVAKVEVTEQT